MDRWSGRWGRVGRKDLVECLATSSCSGTLHKDFHGTYLSKQTISRFRSMVKWTLNKLDMGSPLSSTYLAFDWIVVINYNYASKTQFPGPSFPLFASFHRRSHSATRNPTNLTHSHCWPMSPWLPKGPQWASTACPWGAAPNGHHTSARPHCKSSRRSFVLTPLLSSRPRYPLRSIEGVPPNWQ